MTPHSSCSLSNKSSVSSIILSLVCLSPNSPPYAARRMGHPSRKNLAARQDFGNEVLWRFGVERLLQGSLPCIAQRGNGGADDGTAVETELKGVRRGVADGLCLEAVFYGYLLD